MTTTQIEHEFALGARIRAPYIGGLEGTVIAVQKDLDGGVSYVVSAWSIRAEVFARHTVYANELEGFTVIPSPAA